MKKIITLLMLVLLNQTVSAKKIKFAVDLSTHTVSINGVHLVGDFQAAIGLGPDWDPGMITMAQEGTTAIYSVILDLPAFKKYEYRFVNGTESYEVEFVPDESRVGYDLVDNRWIYLDSIANDTTFLGAIIFGGNAPAGKKLVRYKVDLRLAGGVAATGVHLGTSYKSSFDPKAFALYSFGDGIYEIITYVTAGPHTFLYFNGNTAATTETVTGTCAPAGQRTITVVNDTLLGTVCFNSCEACKNVGVDELSRSVQSTFLYPNPASGVIQLNIEDLDSYEYRISDVQGKILLSGKSAGAFTEVAVDTLPDGIYLLKVQGENQIRQTKMVIAR